MPASGAERDSLKQRGAPAEPRPASDHDCPGVGDEQSRTDLGVELDLRAREKLAQPSGCPRKIGAPALVEPVAQAVEQHGLKARLEEHAFEENARFGEALTAQTVGLGKPVEIAADQIEQTVAHAATPHSPAQGSAAPARLEARLLLFADRRKSRPRCALRPSSAARPPGAAPVA